jgi:hypothetical protein
VKRLVFAPFFVLAVLLSQAASGALNIMPLRDVRAGMHGTGKTVFSGTKIEDFDVEILGVLENTGPKESLILGKLSGGPLDHTGVMQGMSGSPVYVGGKLIGAVALAFPYAKDAIAGIRPIEEMLAVNAVPPVPARPANPSLARLANNSMAALFPAQTEAGAGDLRMTEVATPLSLSGFSANTVERFAPEVKKLGLEPRQGISTGGGSGDRMGNPAELQPGSMISVELMTGDMSVGADGTLTAIDGNKVYAFGHRFLGVGATSLPFTHSEVITLLANVNTSFKISSAKDLMGVIGNDRSSGIAGTAGQRAEMVPLDISIHDAQKNDTYHMKVVNDPLLSPYLLQMALFSAIDSAERATGAATVQVEGSIEFENRKEPVELRNIYAADGGMAQMAAVGTAVPVAYLMQGGFDALKVKRITVNVTAADIKKELAIGPVYLSRKQAKPGDTIELMAQLEGDNGVELTRTVKYTIPRGTAPGTLYFTVADGIQTGLAELRQIIGDTPNTPDELIATVNRLRAGDKAYVRVWRADSAYEVGGQELPNPPASLELILGSTQNLAQNKNSKVAELVLDAAGMAVSGSKTVAIEVKE